MKFDTSFTVNAICNIFDEDNQNIEEKGAKIDLKISKEQASNFLFRFAPPVFMVEDYKVVLRFDNMNCLKAIVLMKNDKLYVIINTNQVISDIMEGYIRLRTSDKILSIMEFDFETALYDDNGVVDEFDLE